ncbi:Cro/Cl family transcriptional regulator [Streptomyces sp. CB01249]|uniref:helix-turn-helix domain-containing protein n=1 Tax=Streptomyces sp. CB01249 TaxID=1703929 RepID=UPI00095C9036|nr:helix-turn-helix domain-containing protein [Streptomyces sp. CB01249]OKJ02802.1 Cro/Cl family transcriptional regulator [Streptomyces sp. CB01249]
MTQSTSEKAAAPPLPSPKERRRLREALSLTEDQVASAVGVTRATVRAWETGRSSPRGRKREAYARLIGAVADSPAPPAPPPPVPVEAPGSVAMAATEPDEAVEPEAAEPDGAVEPEAAVAPEVTEMPEAPEEPPGDPDPGHAPDAPAAAFDALYQYAASALFQQTYLLTGQRALSRAAVTKAFELAWERWPEVAVDRDPVGWVRAAAYEYAMSPWRRLNREHRRLDPPPEAPASRALLDALLALPPSYRRTLVLHDGVGLGLPETAAETEASTRAAAGRLVTARAAVAERLPEIAEPDAPAGQSALIHEHLGTLARSRPVAALPVPELIRTGSERKAQLWARTAIAFTVLIVGLTLITLATAPRKYETPPAPAQKVGGVPPVGGPQKLTPQDVKLRKKLGDEVFHGPARLVPKTG